MKESFSDVSGTPDGVYLSVLESAECWTLHDYPYLSLEEIASLCTRNKVKRGILCKKLVEAVHGNVLSIEKNLIKQLTFT